MVATSVSSSHQKIDPKLVEQSPEELTRESFSLQEWLLEPIDGTEWVDGQIITKNYMGSKHSRAQARLARYWGNISRVKWSGWRSLYRSPLSNPSPRPPS